MYSCRSQQKWSCPHCSLLSRNKQSWLKCRLLEKSTKLQKEESGSGGGGSLCRLRNSAYNECGLLKDLLTNPPRIPLSRRQCACFPVTLVSQHNDKLFFSRRWQDDDCDHGMAQGGIFDKIHSTRIVMRIGS